MSHTATVQTPPALAPLVIKALAESNNDIGEALRRVKKRLADDLALATEVMDALLEREVAREARRVQGAVAPEQAKGGHVSPERAAERAQGLALRAQRQACMDYLLMAAGGLRLGAAEAEDLAREIAALDASLERTRDIKRWLMAIRAKLSRPGQRVADVFKEDELARLREEASAR